MEIDLGTEPAEPVWPVGITARTFRAGEERAVYDVDMEAFQDHWDFFSVPFEDWRDYHLGRSDFDPELWFLAMDGEEIAGTALCSGEVRPDTGRVNVLGVRRPWRRAGWAGAPPSRLPRASPPRRSKADLNVDGENLTGAVRLYERVGMHVAQRDDSYRKDALMELRPRAQRTRGRSSETGIRFGLADETAAGHRSLVPHPVDRPRAGRARRCRNDSIVGYGDVGTLRRRKDPLARRRAEEEAMPPPRLRGGTRTRVGAGGAKDEGVVAEQNAEWRAVLESRGFAFDHYSLRMWIDLHGEVPEAGVAARDQRAWVPAGRGREGRVRPIRRPSPTSPTSRRIRTTTGCNGRTASPSIPSCGSSLSDGGEMAGILLGRRRAGRGLQASAGSTSSACGEPGAGAA